MKILYFDCFSGVSGDMLIGTLVDILNNDKLFLSELKKINFDEFEITLNRTTKNHIACVDAKIIEKTKHNSTHAHRHLSNIVELIDNSSLSEQVKNDAKHVFEKIAQAEAKIHQSTIEEVHFHEVGAIDSIVDVIGVCILINLIKPDAIFSSKIKEGTGFVNCMHGKIPVPVPAVLEVLSQSSLKLEITDVEGEMATPTGVALLSHFAKGTQKMPDMNILKIGYGSGKKDFEHPNVLRAILGEASKKDAVTVIETNIDDLSSEILGYTAELLLKNGAKDVFFTPIFMKKFRPAYKLSVICADDLVGSMEDIILKNTSSLGVRKYSVERTIKDRESKTVSTKYGDIAVKVSHYNGVEEFAPEYDSAKEAAIRSGVTLKEIYQQFGKM